MLIKQGTGAQSCRQRQLGSRCTRANDSKPAQHSLQFMGHKITEQSRSTESEREKKKKKRRSSCHCFSPSHPFRRHLIGGRGWIRHPRTASPDKDQHAVALRRTNGGRGINQSTCAASCPPGHTSTRTAQRAPCTPAGRQAGRLSRARNRNSRTEHNSRQASIRAAELSP